MEKSRGTFWFTVVSNYSFTEIISIQLYKKLNKHFLGLFCCDHVLYFNTYILIRIVFVGQSNLKVMQMSYLLVTILVFLLL